MISITDARHDFLTVSLNGKVSLADFGDLRQLEFLPLKNSTDVLIKGVSIVEYDSRSAQDGRIELMIEAETPEGVIIVNLATGQWGTAGEDGRTHNHGIRSNSHYITAVKKLGGDPVGLMPSYPELGEVKGRISNIRIDNGEISLVLPFRSESISVYWSCGNDSVVDTNPPPSVGQLPPVPKVSNPMIAPPALSLPPEISTDTPIPAVGPNAPVPLPPTGAGHLWDSGAIAEFTPEINSLPLTDKAVFYQGHESGGVQAEIVTPVPAKTPEPSSAISLLVIVGAAAWLRLKRK